VTTLKALTVSSRPLSWVNTAFPFAAAYFIGTQTFDALFFVGTLFFLIPYNVLMYGINDVYDYESDLRNPRKGGAEGGLLPPALHRPMVVTSVAVALPFVAWLVWQTSPLAWLVLAVSLFSVIAYSVPPLRFKEIPFLDSVTSSAHFVTPAVYGLAAGDATVGMTGVTLLAAFFLWGMGSHAFGAVQDVESDRQAGIGSIATVISAKGAVRFALANYLAAGVLLLLTPWPFPIMALAVIPYLAAVLPFWRVSDDNARAAHAGWRWFLAINFLAGAIVTLVGINAGYLPG